MGLKRVGAMWLKDGKKGKFMSGVLEHNGEKINFMVFKNSFKEKDGPKAPDYTINISEDDDPMSAPAKKNEDFQADDSDLPF